jgi:hypothetical protein
VDGPAPSHENAAPGRWRPALGGLAVTVILLAGCSTTATPTTTTATTRPDPGALNVTPCNYARAWHDDPIHFTEFATLAHYAQMADNSDLRSDGRQLSAAVVADDDADLGQAAARVYTTCQRLGLVPAPSTPTG